MLSQRPAELFNESAFGTIQHWITSGSKKSQLFSLDLVVSLVVFLAMVVFLITVWNVSSLRLEEKRGSQELELLAFSISDLLVESKGIPENWEDAPANLEVPGLKLQTGMLDADKVAAFQALDYVQTKKVLNIESLKNPVYPPQ